MKLNKKIRIFALVTAVIACLSTVTAFAADKLDKNMAGEGMSFAERFEFALQGTATGMLMVFAVLGLLGGIVALSKVILHDIPAKNQEKANAEKSAPAPVAKQEKAVEPVAQEASAPVAEASAQDDGELLAVITAAISAMIDSGECKNEFVGGFRVVSFKRSSEGAWNRK